MQRRKFIASIGSVAAGAAAVTGTGAFTSVEANRNVSVQVADDSEAYLSITANDTPNGREYAQTDDSGRVTLDFSEVTDGDTAPASGLNDDATTVIRDVLTIRNQGTQRVLVRISNLPDGMSAFADDFDGVNDQYEPFGITLNANTDTSNLPRLDPGQSLNEVGFNFKTGSDDGSLDDFTGDIVIEALTNEEAGAPADEVASG